MMKLLPISYALIVSRPSPSQNFCGSSVLLSNSAPILAANCEIALYFYAHDTSSDREL